MKKNIWSRLVPRYAVLPLLGCLLSTAVAYYGSRLFNLNMPSHDLSLPLDAHIPLVPVFVIFYVLSYVYWGVSYVAVAREGPERCGALFGEMLAKMICLLFFLLLPTRMLRPEIAGNDIFSRLLRVIYAVDVPNNLFPSIHCLESYICWRALSQSRCCPKWVKGASLVLTLLIFASTVLVHQHVLVDIPAGILVGEMGLQLAQRLQLGQRYSAHIQKQKLNKER